MKPPISKVILLRTYNKKLSWILFFHMQRNKNILNTQNYLLCYCPDKDYEWYSLGFFIWRNINYGKHNQIKTYIYIKILEKWRKSCLKLYRYKANNLNHYTLYKLSLPPLWYEVHRVEGRLPIWVIVGKSCCFAVLNQGMQNSIFVAKIYTMVRACGTTVTNLEQHMEKSRLK